MTKYRYTLPHGDIVDDIYASTDAQAALELERRRPGMSGHVVKVEREPATDDVRSSEAQPTASSL